MAPLATVLEAATRPQAGDVSCLACRGVFRPVFAFGRWSGCPACLLAAEQAHAQQQPATGRSRKPGPQLTRFDLARAAGGNPVKFKHTFDTLPPRPGREAMLATLKEFSADVLARSDRYDAVAGALAWGDTGRGKSEGLHCVLYELLAAGMEPGRDVYFVDAASFAYEVQATYSANEPTWPLIKRLINCDVLLLDDPFAGKKVSADTVAMLTVVLNRREGKPTAWAMNPSPNVLEERYAYLGDDVTRLVSRLGSFRVVQAKGENDGRFLRAG